MPDLSRGSVFAGHRIEGIAGRGGMGTVYRATHLALDHAYRHGRDQGTERRRSSGALRQPGTGVGEGDNNIGIAGAQRALSSRA